MSNSAILKIFPAGKGPEWGDILPAHLAEMAILKRATDAGLSVVSFKVIDRQGFAHHFELTSRVFLAAAAAIKGSNMRLFGKEEP